MAPRKDPLSSVWNRPQRPRSGQPALGREQIVSAALELLDAEGIDGLSMRRLGTKLGSGATSIYWHVANKDELLDLVIDAVMGEVYVPDPGETDWRTAVGTLAVGLRVMILNHPWISSTLGTRMQVGPNSMRLSDRALALLIAVGFTGKDAALAANLLTAYAIGTATTEASWRKVMATTGMTTEDLVKAVDELQQNVAGQYPTRDRWWQEHHSSFDMNTVYDENFTFGLERLLDGLQAWLER